MKNHFDLTAYKIFVSKDYDWYVVAGRHDDKYVRVIYEGHDLDKAYEAILYQYGFRAALIEKDMDNGSYLPSIKDWQGEY
jgi:hypothetical protein